MNKVIWLNNSWFPFEYAFCPSKEAWDKEMENMECNYPYPLSQNVEGSTVCFEKCNSLVKIIVCLKSHNDLIQFTALVVHEAAHVWQQVLEAMGEDKPSSEFEAYALQGITQDLLTAAKDTEVLKL